MYYNKVEICGVNTSKLATLTAEEKRELLLRTKVGDTEARRKLIDGNLRLVLSIIQRFINRGENSDDLFQVGCIGLIKAIDNFNTDLDVKFSTYAVPMIIGEIRRYLRDNNSIRVSRSVRDLAYRALSARELLSRTLGRDPTIEEIVKHLNDNGTTGTVEEVNDALEAIIEPISLFDPVWNDGSSDSIYVMDQISDTQNTDETWIEDIALKEALKKLNDRERSIIDMRFFRGRTQMEIAEEIGISQAQVSRLEKGALERIRKQL
ncbi:MAG: RNA polymerase sporulation sigma factor SigG [Eubacteriales bacterium]|nr:RNA polymerase sporulation sigma factor SigG [Eubacteriales bacterium]